LYEKEKDTFCVLKSALIYGDGIGMGVTCAGMDVDGNK